MVEGWQTACLLFLSLLKCHFLRPLRLGERAHFLWPLRTTGVSSIFILQMVLDHYTLYWFLKIPFCCVLGLSRLLSWVPEFGSAAVRSTKGSVSMDSMGKREGHISNKNGKKGQGLCCASMDENVVLCLCLKWKRHKNKLRRHSLEELGRGRWGFGCAAGRIELGGASVQDLVGAPPTFLSHTFPLASLCFSVSPMAQAPLFGDSLQAVGAALPSQEEKRSCHARL